jgi:putative PEP-CTERM system histidine kinase
VQLTDVGLFSHLIAGVAFFALAISAFVRHSRDQTSLWLAGAAGMTAVWAAAFVVIARGDGSDVWLLSLLETLRTGAWVGFVISLLRASWRLEDRLSSSFFLAGVIGFVTTIQVLLDVVDGIGYGVFLGANAALLGTLFVIGRLIVAISGLVLLHNLYVNAVPASRDGIRLLIIGLAGFFGYDLNLYTLQFLLGDISADLFNIRGAVDAIVVPLLLLSASSSWAAKVQVSRQVVFHTMSFSIIGAYLIVMALTAYGLSLVGGDWGRLLQISFLFGTAILGIVVLVSPRFRAALRVVIAKNFFAYKYDYRQEWLRFIATVSRTGAGSGELSERAIQAICAVLDSPGGAYFAPADDDGFDLLTRWNLRDFTGDRVAPSSGFGQYLNTQHRIVDFDEWRSGGGDYDGMTLPDWAVSDKLVWLGIPLVHLDALCGFILIERSVAPRDLNWEDFDLLRTLGRQAASYIAEASTQATLDEAGAFEQFNRRFAFIMHDIKNLVSQLSLVSRNAERHADNPAFRADMVATLQSSVGKMNDLLARLAQHNTGRPEVREAVDIGALIAQVVAAKRQAHSSIHPVIEGGKIYVDADPARLEQLFVHLLQNAIDASLPDARIDVVARLVGGDVQVMIADHGCGMSAAFVRGELFKPFRSTKPDGFGIGAYEAREIARSLDGRLDVVSREAEGTVFTITLPALVPSLERLQA